MQGIKLVVKTFLKSIHLASKASEDCFFSLKNDNNEIIANESIKRKFHAQFIMISFSKIPKL